MPDNSNDIFGIGIESSCDETGIAIIKNGNEIIANPVFSQIDLHKIYGGVVPEMASRMHLEKFPALLQEILNQYRSEFNRASYIAVTVRPGLTGSLLIGYYLALGIKTVLKVPVIPIHHLEAHFYANVLDNELFKNKTLEYPFIGLLLSGGNSSIYKVSGLGKLELIGDTLDDACGEAYDKAAALLGLDYPGGPEIEKRAKSFYESNPELKRGNIETENPLPKILKDQNRNQCNFSFSGIKTALYYFIRSNPDHDTDHLCWCFQERVFDIIERNVKHALSLTKFKNLVTGGGVMSNQTLRKRISSICDEMGVKLYCPSPSLCTDNGAMIGALGYYYFKENVIYPHENVISSKTEFFSSY
ncbi:MAG: tRNA (adenosine(37)-N6)-threonylcarbamoyltransferase complex transferase subunit TsaD [Spirochaetia bacterium]|nr:tRNA (adenosine(37)-N6)-threonylcarbamoyltransferase complex transferase subunit TsaD [Spirochaetia bacterium]